MPHLLAVGDETTGTAILAAIDGAIGAITGIELDFADVERQADRGRVGGRSWGGLASAEQFLEQHV